MTKREHTAIDNLAEQYFDAEVALSPLELTSLGSSQRQDEFDDLSPAGFAQKAELKRATLAKLDDVAAVDETDRVTAAALRERLTLDLDEHEIGADMAVINNIETGLHLITQAFDQMPVDTAANWETIAKRLHAIPAAIEGWFESQEAGLDLGIVPAIRQVNILAEQAASYAADGGYFDLVLDRARRSGVELSGSTKETLEDGVRVAKTSYASAAEILLSQFAPKATPTDAVGPDRYTLASAHFVGEAIDFEKTYRWGLSEVARLDEEQAAIAAKLRPGLSIYETKASLNTDEAYLLHGKDELKAWMQRKADQAIADLNGVHFDIPEPLQRIECMIADTTDGGIYYTQPSEDFSRPGRMWWSVPPGVETFGTWSELTTVYHEGTPGHHLQLGTAMYLQDSLNRWRRSGVWVSGSGEGWALYAEKLMDEFGYHEDPGTKLGVLDSEALRATRVVLDIGLHSGFEAPAEVGGGEWTWDKAWTFFNTHVTMAEGNARFELTRYFGWPGQAPAYKLGQHAYLQMRESARTRDGAAFDLKAFHAKALSLGSLGLATIRAATNGDFAS
jgi:uncharacterized protein (DUF885 family)